MFICFLKKKIFILYTRTEMDVNLLTNWIIWRISVLACFLRCQRFSWRHLHSGAEETRSRSPPRSLCERQIRLILKGKMILTFTCTFTNSTFSNAVLPFFTGYLHVSCAGYRVWRLLCAIAGKIIRGMTCRRTGDQFCGSVRHRSGVKSRLFIL